jgi:RNA polymerase sigma factor (TIGR02999 family)
MNQVSRILDAIGQGDPLAAEKLFPLVYDELRRLATQQLAHEKLGQTLQSTALVHEAYLRLVGEQQFANRRHFFAAAVEAMRRILVENARRKQRRKRGGNMHRIKLEDVDLTVPENGTRLLALDEALDRFAEVEPAKAQLVKLRWFGGLSLDAAAELLDISPSTADRWWAYARAWLRAEIAEEKSS